MKTTDLTSGAFGSEPVATSPPGSPPTAPSEIDLVQLAFQYKWVLLGGLLAGVFFGQTVYWYLGPTYEANSKVLVSKRISAPIGEDSDQTWGDRAEHIALIMSPMIVDQAIQKHDLTRLPSLAGSDDPADDIIGDLRVKRTAGDDRSFLNVLEIAYHNPSPQDAEVVLSAVIAAYQDYLEETRQHHTAELVRLVSKAHEELSQELSEREQDYLKFREQAPLQWRNPPGAEGMPGDVVNVHQERLVTIEAELRNNLLKRTEINAQIKAIEEAVESGESHDTLLAMVRQFQSARSSIADSASTASPVDRSPLESQRVSLILEEKRLLRDFGPEHPDVQTVRNSLAALRELASSQGVGWPEHQSVIASDNTAESSDLGIQISQDAQRNPVHSYLGALHQQLKALGHRDRELESLMSRESILAKKYSHYQSQDLRMSEEIQRLKTLWEAVVGQLNEMKLVKESSGYSLQQIAPVRSSFLIKRYIKILGGGTLFILGLTSGLVYLREWSDISVRTLDELRSNQHGWPLLGAVPHFQPSFEENATPSPGAHSSRLCTLHEPGSPEAEAFRSIRTALQVGVSQHQTPVIQVSSAEPGDGKSTLAANLAVALAQSEKKVLLIDADLRRPSLQSLFGARHNIGLADVLAGEVAWENVVQPSGIKRLTLLTAGVPLRQPSELLSSSRLHGLLQAVRREFDFVLIDSSPLLAVSDPRILGRVTDGILLVVRLSKNNRPELQQTYDLLQTHGIAVVGLAANDLVASHSFQYDYRSSARNSETGGDLSDTMTPSSTEFSSTSTLCEQLLTAPTGSEEIKVEQSLRGQSDSTPTG